MANWEPNNSERLTGLADQLPTDGQVRRLLQRREVDDASERIRPDQAEEAKEVAAPSGRETAASRPRNEVSPREREDEARRDEREFGPFVCQNPFESWIQDVIDGKGIWHED